MNIDEIASRLEADLSRRVQRSGMMYRLFSRVKKVDSLRHKIKAKGEEFFSNGGKIQDIIGLRIILYFPDDVETMSVFLGSRDVVRSSIDECDMSTFCPRRLNITKNIPTEYIDDYRRNLPADLSDKIDNTFEVQIRTVFSEGWHEVEHDLRYKCKEDWIHEDVPNRTLNGMIATLETIEWGMKSLFHEMAYRSYRKHNYRAMLRNKMRIRFASLGFSPEVKTFLDTHREVAKQLLGMDRMVFMLTMLNHENPPCLTYDNVVFLANKIDLQNTELFALEKQFATQEQNTIE